MKSQLSRLCGITINNQIEDSSRYTHPRVNPAVPDVLLSMTTEHQEFLGWPKHSEESSVSFNIKQYAKLWACYPLKRFSKIFYLETSIQSAQQFGDQSKLPVGPTRTDNWTEYIWDILVFLLCIIKTNQRFTGTGEQIKFGNSSSLNAYKLRVLCMKWIKVLQLNNMAENNGSWHQK